MRVYDRRKVCMCPPSGDVRQTYMQSVIGLINWHNKEAVPI